MLRNGKNVFVVFAYDVSCDKRRQKVAKLLEKYGERVNYSVFECFVAESTVKEIKAGLNQIINLKRDSVVVYYLCKRCLEKNNRLGIGQPDLRVVKSL